jgi:hypothetical protein
LIWSADLGEGSDKKSRSELEAQELLSSLDLDDSPPFTSNKLSCFVGDGLPLVLITTAVSVILELELVVFVLFETEEEPPSFTEVLLR